MRKSWMRAFPLLLGLVLAASGCERSLTESSAGTVEGSITIAPSNAINFHGWKAQLYTSLQTWQDDAGTASVTVSGSNGSFSFRLDNVTAGTYYADICHPNFGCVMFNASDPIDGLPDAFQVQNGATTRLQLTLQAN